MQWLADHPYTLIFLLIAIFTRKDLAVFCFLASLSSAFLWDANPYNPLTYAAFAGLNALLVLLAGWYNVIHSTKLSKAVMVLCMLGAMVNGWQVIEISVLNYYVSLALGFLLMASLIFMDGRKGLLNGLWQDLRDSISRHVRIFSHKNNNGIFR